MIEPQEEKKDIVCPYCLKGHDWWKSVQGYTTMFSMICIECGQEFSVEPIETLLFTTREITNQGGTNE
jgi:DNA-directed RNA polymerase subunit RPC12/RpoP